MVDYGLVNGKKLIDINDVIVIKKKSLYKIVVSMSLRLTLLEKTHTQFDIRIYTK